MEWISPKDKLPQKTGTRNYEQIPCLVKRNGELQFLQWNCEHLCWDDESGDDYECEAAVVEYYIEEKRLLELLPLPTKN